ncbi:MAG: rRNA maturation RNase YbeY [Caulobacteraceae bacterium]|nr:rRNA maturation RNase YbeY [Caulobacter sp.]
MTVEVEVEDAAWAAALPDVEALAQAAAQAALAGATGAWEVIVLLADDAAVRDLNARFRGKDAATNVLSFPAAPSAAPHLGDVALASGVCAREAAAQGKPLAHHLQHLVVHGVLHLLSFDHETDVEAEEMEALERTVLAGLGVPDPYRAAP